MSLHNIQVTMYQTGTPAYVTSRKVKTVAGFALCFLSSTVYLCWCRKLQPLQVACYILLVGNVCSTWLINYLLYTVRFPRVCKLQLVSESASFCTAWRCAVMEDISKLT